MSDKCEMCGESTGDGGSGRLHDTYDCAVALRAQLRASEAEVARLTRELEDVRKLDEWKERNAWRGVEEWLEVAPGKVYVVKIEARGRVTGDSFTAARRAAVEYLEKEKADG